ncbi:hypothetical protein C2E21_5262 [Chlorella sorokiniana]|uniref:Uncharacterized protein n=1 Tax=Chlorella sorokiniana TaxID=3076 RepID=A0A2P6TPJ0_CHLSO|nr:hypothetical protein C2E21_5262 [Chlorella sorokiniana]|eukprot:PRW55948.1 hypothetical protein C2E21_5262 [Chlorella sorokiniana]
MAPGEPSGSRGSPPGDPSQLLGFHGQPLSLDPVLFSPADRGRTRQRSGPPAHAADGSGSGFLMRGPACLADGGQAALGFAGASRIPRSSSAPPGRMELQAAGESSDQVLAQLQRTQQELQRQRAEQEQWAAAAQQLLRAHGHALPQATSPPGSQQQRRRELPPLPSPPNQQRRPASVDLKPSHDLCQAFASLQADLGVIEQQQHNWEARRVAHQSALAQEQAQWETRRAAEQWSWDMRRQAEEQAWRQARRQQEEAWLDKRRQEEREWTEKRRREDAEQRDKRQRAEQQWLLECQRAQQQLQQQQRAAAAPPQSQLYGKPALGLQQGKPPASYSGGSGSGSSGGSTGLPPPPLPAVMEGDSMQLDLLTFDSLDFMEMARELGLASPLPSLELMPADLQNVQLVQQGGLGTLGALGHPASVPQPFSPLPVQQPVGTAPGQQQAAGLGQQAQRAQRGATSPPASY